MAGKFEPTDSQKLVLKDKSNNLLVSASAGSGKTATIIQKISNLIVKDKIDIQKLLVITFTESASLEMKMRLKEKLFEEVLNDNSLISQIDKLPTSDISTIHGFCSKQMRKYFYELDLNPNFFVLDNNNSKFLKGTAINKVIEEYSSKQDDDFVNLSQIFGGRNFSSLKESVLSLYEFLCSVENKDDYLKNIATTCYKEINEQNPVSKIINDYILSNINYLKSILNGYKILAESMKANYFVNFIEEYLVTLSGITYQKTFLENRQEVLNIVIPSITRKKTSDEDALFKKEFQSFFDESKKTIKDLVEQVINKKIEDVNEDLQKASLVIEKLIEVETLFEDKYEKLKKNRNALDFNDLEKTFLKLVNIDRVCQAIQDNYQYIFVDEYQDINNVQELILNKLTNNNNIVMVGDVKQSIYGFRNSTPSIFVNKSVNFENNSSTGTLINLNENFRSNPDILNFVNQIFNVCMSAEFGGVNYKENSELRGMTQYKVVNDESVVSLHLINTKKDDEEIEEIEENYPYPYSVIDDKNSYKSKLTMARKEGIIVAQKILELITKNYYEAKVDKSKKINFEDIVILSRRHSFLKEIESVLLEYKIPVSFEVNNDIYKNPDIGILLSILKIINNSHDDVSLSVALTSFLGNFTYDEISTIRNKYIDEEYFYESVNNYLTNQNDKLQNKLKIFFDKINNLRESLTYLSIYELLNDMQREYDYLSYYHSLPNGEDRYNALKHFIDSFENAEYNNDLNRYIDYIENYAEDLDADNSCSSNPNSVKLGTIHSSKGLEYPIVFLVGTGKGFTDTTFRKEVLKDKEYGLGMKFYDLENSEKHKTLAVNAITINLKKQEKAEELRLLYVALTRAKNHLYITGSKNINNINRIKNIRESVSANSFLNWILCALSDVGFNGLKEGNVDFVDKHKNFETSVKVYGENFFDPVPQNEISLTLKEIKNNEVEKLNNSFDYVYEKDNNLALKNTVSSMLQEHTNLEASINIEPKKLLINEYKKEGIDASRLGTIYHKIMQEIDFNKTNASEEKLIQEIVDSFKMEEKYKNKISVTKLSKCIKKIQELNVKKTLKEQPFLSYMPYDQIFENSLVKDKILIQGVADLIVETDKERILIDYKTTKANSKNELADKYNVQLKLYKLCLEKATNIKIDKVLIYSFYFDDFISLT